MLLGALPANGDGNYFIAIALQFVVLLPALRWLLAKGPWVFLGTCFAIDLSFQVLAGQFALNDYLFKACILRYLFLLALGMLLASGHRFWPLLPVSFAYLVAVTMGVKFPFITGWDSQALFAAGYTIALVTLGLRFRYPRLLEELGRASWHIFLVQILWFGQVADIVAGRLGLHAAASVAVSVAVCLAIGLFFARVEQWATARVQKRWRASHPTPA
jgi:hypothetical protein